MTGFAPEILRQRLIVEGYYTRDDVDELASRSSCTASPPTSISARMDGPRSSLRQDSDAKRTRASTRSFR